MALFRLEAGVDSARAHFNFRELPRYFSSTNQIWRHLLKCIEEQVYGKILRQGYHLLPWQTRF